MYDRKKYISWRKYDRMMNRTRKDPSRPGQNNASIRGKNDKRKWYTAGGKYDSVMFVEATPNAEFKKRAERVVKKYELKIRVVERVGITVKGLLQRSNPLGMKTCDRENV